MTSISSSSSSTSIAPSSQNKSSSPCNKDAKTLICGVCRNVEKAVKNTIENIEELSKRFKDYAVIICEDNSNDKTVALFLDWAKTNSKVIFQSEKYSDENSVREVKITRARNRVLKIAKDKSFNDFDYLIMADLDFLTPWPIDEIVNTTLTKRNWDCVSANGIFEKGYYYDRYAFRDSHFPLGDELIRTFFWDDVRTIKLVYPTYEKEWFPLFSGYGGLAIYKRKSIIDFSYSGEVTEDLAKYYEKIISKIGIQNKQIAEYNKTLVNEKLLQEKSQKIDSKMIMESAKISVQELFSDKGLKSPVETLCCEHLPLHASMALNGFGHFYLNPKLVMKYDF